MVRIVRCLVSDIGKEGFAIFAVGVDKLNHLVGVGAGCVVVVGQFAEILTVFSEYQLGCEGGHVGHVPVIATTVQQREITLETPRPRNLVRRFSKMPLAGHVSVVTGLFKQLRQGYDRIVEVAFVAGFAFLIGRSPFVHVTQPVEMGVDSGEHRRAGGRTTGMRVELGEAYAVVGQCIQVRCFDFTAERPHVRIAHIVCQDNDDIGSLGSKQLAVAEQ